MSKDGSNLSKSFFGCYFCCSLVNFKNFVILFQNIWVICCRKYKSIYDESIIFFITNKLSLQLEALSNCDNFTVITILYNNDVLTWDYKDNNKYQVTMS